MIKYSSDSDAKQQVLITGIDMGIECRISDTSRISSLGDWVVLVLRTDEGSIGGRFFYIYMHLPYVKLQITSPK